MLKGHLPRVIYHQAYWYTKIKDLGFDLFEDAIVLGLALPLPPLLSTLGEMSTLGESRPLESLLSTLGAASPVHIRESSTLGEIPLWGAVHTREPSTLGGSPH